MRICLNVTWPIGRIVCLPVSEGLASDLIALRGQLRQDLACISEDCLWIRGLFGRENEVQDVDRYRIVRLGRSIEVKDQVFVNDENYVSTYPYVDRPISAWDGATLVIVLESPHRDEYGSSVVAPIAPARGATGANMHKHLCCILNHCTHLKDILLSSMPVRAVISNPVPFQTSAYSIHGGRLPNPMRLRNVIWRGLWRLQDVNQLEATQDEDEQLRYVFQRKFREKVVSYMPIAIVNACTGVFREEVTEVLQGLPDNILLYEARRHPSAWVCETELTFVDRS